MPEEDQSNNAIDVGIINSIPFVKKIVSEMSIAISPEEKLDRGPHQFTEAAGTVIEIDDINLYPGETEEEKFDIASPFKRISSSII